MENVNFYTQNGWVGKNYSTNISSKEVAEKVREYCKKTYPEWRFSVRYKGFSGGCEINVTLKGGPIPCPIINKDGRSFTDNWGIQIHSGVSDNEDRLVPEVIPMLKDVFDYLNSYNYSDCDGQIDYFNVKFWVGGGVVGLKEWKVVEKKASKPEKQPSTEPIAHGSVKVIRYSDRCLAIIGDTKPLKNLIKEQFKGRFNPALTIDGQKVAGWVVAAKNFSIETLEEALS